MKPIVKKVLAISSITCLTLGVSAITAFASGDVHIDSSDSSSDAPSTVMPETVTPPTQSEPTTVTPSTTVPSTDAPTTTVTPPETTTPNQPEVLPSVPNTVPDKPADVPGQGHYVPATQPVVNGTGTLPFTGPGEVAIAILVALIAGTGGMVLMLGASGREVLEGLNARTMNSASGFKVAYRELLKRQFADEDADVRKQSANSERSA